MKAKRSEKTTPITRPEITERFVQVYYDLYGGRVVTSMKDFCDNLELNPSNFSQMRKGNMNCSLANVCKMIEVYNVSPNWLLTNKGSMYQCQP